MAGQPRRTAATAALLAVLSAPACAQLSIRLEPELDDPGTSAMPARLGYARSNGEASAALQMAIVYDLKPTMPRPNATLEPYAALTLHDNAAIDTDTKKLELGVRSTIGDLGSGLVYLVDGAVGRKSDHAVGSSGYLARIGTELVDRFHLKHGLGHTEGTPGWFIRPKLGLYYLKTQKTDSPAAAPLGSAAGAWLGLEADLYPSFSARTKLSYAGKFAHDAHASGERLKDNYRKHTISAEYLLFNYIDPPKGQPQFSLTVNRSLGADPLDGSPVKKSSTGLYLGMKL